TRSTCPTTARSRRCAWRRRRPTWCAASWRRGCVRGWNSCRSSPTCRRCSPSRRSRSSAWPAPSRRCATCYSSSATCSTTWCTARRKLEPEGAFTGATRELQAGLGLFLQICHEHGVKVGPWRLCHVVPEWTFGDHPTYGALTIAHWVCKDGQPWKVGVGLFLGKGPAKPRDLAIKLTALEVEPAVLDHLILL